MSIMEEVYDQLNQHDFVNTAEEFSTGWCSKSKSWYAVQKNKQGEFTIPVAINCLNKVKVRIVVARMGKKKLGTIAEQNVQALSAVREKLEQYLLNEHRITGIADND